MVIEIHLPKEIDLPSNDKQKQKDRFTDSLFLELMEAAKIVSESNKNIIITIKRDEVIWLGYDDKINFDEFFLGPIFKQIENETGMDIEEMILEGKIQIKI